MYFFWEEVLYPIFLYKKPKFIVEIGADKGINTKKIIKYCTLNNSHLSVIDPKYSFKTNNFEKNYPDNLTIYKGLSLDVLPNITRYDVVLIDGDHNWYTVYYELKLIEKYALKIGKFPLVFHHDTDWPYARRDMYYNPETIPSKYLLSYAKKGMKYGESKLVESGGFNDGHYNAYHEGGKRNGVLTAIEDFLSETSIPLQFNKIDIANGLGIISTDNRELTNFIKLCFRTLSLRIGLT